MNKFTPPFRQISFGRHAIAILCANFIVASLFAVYTAALTAFETGSVSMVLMIAFVIWLGTFAIAAPVSGFLFTLAWPFLRKTNSLGWLVSTLIGVEGGYASIWANYAAVGKRAPAGDLTAATFMGAILGFAYWIGASGRSWKQPQSDPSHSETELADGSRQGELDFAG